VVAPNPNIEFSGKILIDNVGGTYGVVDDGHWCIVLREMFRWFLMFYYSVTIIVQSIGIIIWVNIILHT
jgi:hypothetical protein